MTGTLALLAALTTAFFYWLSGARARELATAVIDELCQRRGFQLLDGTVSLARLGLVRTDEGMRFRRLFRFDYSVEGLGRQQGNILLHGSRVALVDLLDNTPPAASDAGPIVSDKPSDDEPPTDNKVIPFRRRD